LRSGSRSWSGCAGSRPYRSSCQKNTIAVAKEAIPSLWEGCREVLTRGEFCGVVGVSRTSLWRYEARRAHAGEEPHEVLRPVVREASEDWQDASRALCEQFVTYGYRRIHAMLARDGYVVGKHKLRRWMRQAGLLQSGPVKDTGRTVGSRPPEPVRPNEAWQIDSTKILTDLDGWVWQTSMLDLYDRRVVGYVVRKTCRAEDAKDTLAIALDREFGEMTPEGLSLIHDRGSQFTAWSFKEMVESADINDVMTAVRHPQSCGRLERFQRTLKEELIWLSEWESLEHLEQAVDSYVHHYNNGRIHSALAYQTPMQTHRLAIAGETSLQSAA